MAHATYFKCAKCGKVKRAASTCKKIICCGYQDTPSTMGEYIDYRRKQKKAMAVQDSKPSMASEPCNPVAPSTVPAAEELKKPEAQSPASAPSSVAVAEINLEPAASKQQASIEESEEEKQKTFLCGACGGQTKSRTSCDKCGVSFA